MLFRKRRFYKNLSQSKSSPISHVEFQNETKSWKMLSTCLPNLHFYYVWLQLGHRFVRDRMKCLKPRDTLMTTETKLWKHIARTVGPGELAIITFFFLQFFQIMKKFLICMKFEIEFKWRLKNNHNKNHYKC